jgi:hypothetical protein
LDIYENNGLSNQALGIAISRPVCEQMGGILIRNKIDFSYICPDIVLDSTAISKYRDCRANDMLVHIGKIHHIWDGLRSGWTIFGANRLRYTPNQNDRGVTESIVREDQVPAFAIFHKSGKRTKSCIHGILSKTNFPKIAPCN